MLRLMLLVWAVSLLSITSVHAQTPESPYRLVYRCPQSRRITADKLLGTRKFQLLIYGADPRPGGVAWIYDPFSRRRTSLVGSSWADIALRSDGRYVALLVNGYFRNKKNVWQFDLVDLASGGRIKHTLEHPLLARFDLPAYFSWVKESQLVILGRDPGEYVIGGGLLVGVLFDPFQKSISDFSFEFDPSLATVEFSPSLTYYLGWSRDSRLSLFTFGRNTRTVVSNDVDPATFVWNPAGDQIAFTKNRVQLHTYHLPTNRERMLFDIVRFYSTQGQIEFSHNPWSFDSRFVAFDRYETISWGAGRRNLLVADLARQELIDFCLKDPDPGSTTGVIWSPDSTLLAWTGTTLPNGEGSTVFLLDIASGYLAEIPDARVIGWIDPISIPNAPGPTAIVPRNSPPSQTPTW